MLDIAREMKQFPDVKYRYYITPSVDLPMTFIVPIYYSDNDKKKIWKLGYKDGLKVIKEGKYTSFDKLINTNKIHHK
jgi:hypothetical protein